MSLGLSLRTLTRAIPFSTTLRSDLSLRVANNSSGIRFFAGGRNFLLEGKGNEMAEEKGMKVIKTEEACPGMFRAAWVGWRGVGKERGQADSW